MDFTLFLGSHFVGVNTRGIGGLYALAVESQVSNARYGGSRHLYRISTGDVFGQGIDGMFVAFDDPLDEIADGDEADDFIILHDREMAEMFLCHQVHAILNGMFGRDRDDVAGHDLAHLGVFRVVALEDTFAGVVAFREDADQTLVFHHHQSANVMLGH